MSYAEILDVVFSIFTTPGGRTFLLLITYAAGLVFVIKLWRQKEAAMEQLRDDVTGMIRKERDECRRDLADLSAKYQTMLRKMLQKNIFTEQDTKEVNAAHQDSSP